MPAPFQDLFKSRLVPLQKERERRGWLAQRGAPAITPPHPAFASRLAEVKQRIDIISVAALLGLPVIEHWPSTRRRFRCPVHGDGNDKNPSGVLYTDQNRYWCFGCGTGGSMIDLVIAFGAATSAGRALEWLESHSGIPQPLV